MQRALSQHKDLLDHFRGMENVIDDAIETFLLCLPQMKNAIQEAIQSGNLAKLEISAHTLKSATSHFKATQAMRLAQALEDLGRQRRLQGAQDLRQDLERELIQLEALLREAQIERQRSE